MKPISALCNISHSATPLDRDSYTGVGLPKVFLRSPATTFLGDRYSFSNNSASSVTVLLRALPFIEDMDSSFSSECTWDVMAAREGQDWIYACSISEKSM